MVLHARKCHKHYLDPKLWTNERNLAKKRILITSTIFKMIIRRHEMSANGKFAIELWPRRYEKMNQSKKKKEKGNSKRVNKFIHTGSSRQLPTYHFAVAIVLSKKYNSRDIVDMLMTRWENIDWTSLQFVSSYAKFRNPYVTEIAKLFQYITKSVMPLS